MENKDICTNDSCLIQSLINNARENGENKAVIPRINPSTGKAVWNIEKAIFLPSDFTLVLDNCHLRLADGVYCNMFCNENAYSENCAQQHDITITGIGNALLDGGTPNGLTEKTANENGMPEIIHNTMIFFRNVSGFTVEHIRIREQRWWGMTFMHCDRGRISNIDFHATNITPNQDGIDLRAGCHDILIENISGRTGDDTIALTALAGRLFQKYKIENKNNDIYNVVIRNICSYVTGGHHIVRLLNHDGLKLYNILIDGIMDRSDDLRAKAALKIGDERYSAICKAALHDTKNITAQNIISRAKAAVLLGGTVSNSYFSNICQDGPFAIQSSACEVENLRFDAIRVNGGGIYNFEKTIGSNVVISNVITPVENSLNICLDSIRPEMR